MNKKEILEVFKSEKAINLFEKYNLNSVVLFGSIVKDDFNEYSDVDIAILGKEKIAIDDSLEIEMQLLEMIDREIDLIDLNEKSLDIFVKINILNDGQSIYTKDNDFLLSKIKDQTEWKYRENENFFYFRRRDVLR